MHSHVNDFAKPAAIVLFPGQLPVSHTVVALSQTVVGLGVAICKDSWQESVSTSEYLYASGGCQSKPSYLLGFSFLALLL